MLFLGAKKFEDAMRKVLPFHIFEAGGSRFQLV